MNEFKSHFIAHHDELELIARTKKAAPAKKIVAQKSVNLSAYSKTKVVVKAQPQPQAPVPVPVPQPQVQQQAPAQNPVPQAPPKAA